MLRDHAHSVVPEERRPAGHHLVEHRAEGVEVGAGVRSTPQRLLGRHIGDCTDHHAVRGHAAAVQGHRQAEVAQHRRPFGSKPDVAGLEVAVDDAVLVRVVQRQRHLLGRTYGLVDRQPVPFSVRELLLHRAARHIARDDVGLSFVLAHVVHHDHVRVIAQAPHRLRLAPHAH